jgi:hypothetical protein
MFKRKTGDKMKVSFFKRYSAKIVFTLLVLGSAISDIVVTEVVATSMKTLGYPLYLAPFLGFLKILGLLGIWQSRSVKVRDFALAGFFFDHLGASYSNAILGFPLAVDGVMAPLFLLMTVFVYVIEYRSDHRASLPTD